MFRWLWKLLYGSAPAAFRSAYGIAESVERLRAVTKRSVFSAMGETTAVGKVSEQAVRLQRVIPMVGNSFKPFFIGRFEEREGRVVLAGKFTMLPIVKVFMTFWLGAVAMFGGAMLLGGHPTGDHAGLFVLQPFLMLGAGVALVAVGKWFARNDAAWLSRVIEGALGLHASNPIVSPNMRSEADDGTVPTVLKITAFFLAVSGAAAVVSGFAIPNLARDQLAPPGMPEFPTLGRWNLVYAALTIALAFGVWRRRQWAWQGVLAVLVLSGCWTIYAMFVMTGGAGPPVAIKVIFAVLSCAVVGIWGRWWYAQRKHFIG